MPNSALNRTAAKSRSSWLAPCYERAQLEKMDSNRYWLIVSHSAYIFFVRELLDVRWI
jgi:hypothetical protein